MVVVHYKGRNATDVQSIATPAVIFHFVRYELLAVWSLFFIHNDFRDMLTLALHFTNNQDCGEFLLAMQRTSDKLTNNRHRPPR